LQPKAGIAFAKSGVLFPRILDQKTDMNLFSFLTLLGGVLTVVSFLSGSRAIVRNHQERRCNAEWAQWRIVFQGAVFLTILAAPLSR
jgi:hypothetical protein